MSRGGRGGGGWSDDPEWVRSRPRGPDPRGPRMQPDYDDPWGGPVRPRGRSAIHDPWGGGRRGRGGGFDLPFRVNPLVLGGIVLFVFAFLLGRCTAGGGDDEKTIATTNSTVAPSTTVLTAAPLVHVVKEKETLALIASRYGVTINDIAIFNNIGDQNNIFVGQTLKIPQGPVVTTTSTTLKKGKN